MDLASVRATFADEMRTALRLRSQALVAAFASVPREDFVGPGPWLISEPDGYRRTPDADPRHLYADVLVALDDERELNNGRPWTHARWLDALAPQPGEYVVHVGAGVGYYSAILASLVGRGGRVTAIEVNPMLLPRLRQNVAQLPQVQVVSGSALGVDFGAPDGIYANAALTAPPAAWLDRLRSGGRMILPLTEMVSETAAERSGAVLWLKRISDDYEARFLSVKPDQRMYPCQDGRSAADEALLARAFARGGHLEVRSLRRTPHVEEAHCWLHGADFCLSRLAPHTFS